MALKVIEFRARWDSTSAGKWIDSKPLIIEWLREHPNIILHPLSSLKRDGNGYLDAIFVYTEPEV